MREKNKMTYRIANSIESEIACRIRNLGTNKQTIRNKLKSKSIVIEEKLNTIDLAVQLLFVIQCSVGTFDNLF